MDIIIRARDAITHSLGDVQVYEDLMAKSRATPAKPDAKLRVIGAGFSKTATLSMYSAMLDLGYKCYHGIELECAPGMSEKWIKVLEHDLKTGSTKGIDWADILRGYDAGFDSPFGDYWLELSQAYPDAKLVYTHRDGHQWMQSYRNTVLEPMHESISFRIAGFWFPSQKKILKIVDLVLAKYQRDFGGLHHTLLDKRLEAIKKEIPPERLLVFHPSQGWEPLCQFLGVPVPDKPFPKVNDGPSMAWALRVVSIVGVGLWFTAIAIVVGAGVWSYNHL